MFCKTTWNRPLHAHPGPILVTTGVYFFTRSSACDRTRACLAGYRARASYIIMDESEADAGKTDSEPELQLQLQTWKKHVQEIPLRLLVCGLGGVGKSTLVNRLLQLGDEKWAEEGDCGKATTSVVSKYERTTEKGIKVCIFDSPGFSDIDLSDKDIIDMVKKKTEGKIHLLIYCISLDHPARVKRSDIKALKIITEAFTNEIWSKAFIVLTFANKLAETKQTADDYFTVIENIKKGFKEVLCREKVHEEIISSLPIVTAGHTDPILKYEEDKSPQAWDDRLFLEMLKRVDPSVLPALFECRWSWADFIKIYVKGVRVTIGAGILLGAVTVIGGAITLTQLDKIIAMKMKQWLSKKNAQR